MAPHSSTLAWKILRTEEPGRPQSMGSLLVGQDSATSLSLFTFHFHALEKEMETHSSVLAWRIPGTGEPGGLPSMESHRVGHDWSDLAATAGHHRAPNWAPCAIQQVPTSYLFYSWGSVYMSIPISQFILPVPHVHKSILYICISIHALRIVSSEPKMIQMSIYFYFSSYKYCIFSCF